MSDHLTAEAFLAQLWTLQSDAELAKIGRYFKSGSGQYGEGDRFIGVRMGQVFGLAETFRDLPPDQIERLLDSDIHEARAGALSIMSRQYRHKTTGEDRRATLYDLYLRRHDRINNWDLVDLAAWHVVGRHLLGRPRDILYELARSPDLWRRRTAMLATFAFIKRGEVADALAIAELLLADPHDLIHKAVGGMLRAVGDPDRPALAAFLDRQAAAMPRTMLRTAIEHFDAAERTRYLALKPRAR